MGWQNHQVTVPSLQVSERVMLGSCL